MEYSKSFFYIILVIVLWSFDDNGCNGAILKSPIIKVDQGTLEGRTVATKSGFQYDSYQGIPYAEPPLGDLRFRNPIPPGKWNGVLNATATGSSCIQFDPLFQNIFYGNEDCLFINVYVPKTCFKSEDLAVMVWIHGGGFIVGDGTPTIYGPDYFVEREVILVTLNYRLGVFGFLSLNTPDVPGNAGLKDQSLALKWVQQNIAKFGGDPKKVTIFGESAGAASVHYQILSPMSKGLFSGAIIQSGSSLCPWALQKDPVPVAKEVARVLSNGEDIKDIGKYLRTIPAVNLTFAALSPNLLGTIKLSFSPTIEKTFSKIVPFITSSPKEIMNCGNFNKVPTISGALSHEGLVYRTIGFSIPEDVESIQNNTIPGIRKFVPDELIAKYGNNIEAIEAIIRQHYFPTVENLSDKLTDLFSDFAFLRGIMKSVELFAKHSSPAYFYRFPYSGSINLLRFISDLQYTSSAHTDELGYMFNAEISGINKVPLTNSDELIRKRLLHLWTNFAKFRNPTPQVSSVVPLLWSPVNAKSSDISTLDIDLNLQMISNPFAEVKAFWDDLMNNSH